MKAFAQGHPRCCMSPGSAELPVCVCVCVCGGGGGGGNHATCSKYQNTIRDEVFPGAATCSQLCVSL